MKNRKNQGRRVSDVSDSGATSAGVAENRPFLAGDADYIVPSDSAQQDPAHLAGQNSDATGSEVFASSLPSDQPAHKEYPPWVAVVYLTNMALGAGILGLPETFFNSGLLLGVFSVLVCSFFTYVIYMYALSCLMRAEAMTNLVIARRVSLSQAGLISDEDTDSQSGHELVEKSLTDAHTTLDDLVSSVGTVTVAQFNQECRLVKNNLELNSIFGMFGYPIFGQIWLSHRFLYTASLAIGTVIILWSYAVLFGQSLSSTINLYGSSGECSMSDSLSNQPKHCGDSYRLYILIFMIITAILVFLDFTEQVIFQVTTCVLRFLAVIAMFAFSLAWLADENGPPESVRDSDDYEAVSIWRFSGLFSVFVVTALANMNQFAVKAIADPLSTADKTKMPSVLMISVWLAALIFISLISVTAALGSETVSPTTLSWAAYTSKKDIKNTSIMVRMISWFIVLFPALDVTSVFPLVCISCVDSVMQDISLIGCYHSTFSQCYRKLMRFLNPNQLDISQQHIDHYVFKSARLLTTVGSCVIAMIFDDFELLLEVSGILTLLGVGILLCLAELNSQKVIKQVCIDLENLSELSRFHWTSKPIIVYSTLIFCLFSIVGSIIELT